MMGSNIATLKHILASNTIENEDVIEQFIKEAEGGDADKVAAIDRFFMNSPSANPFDAGLGYYDLLQHYEDIQDERD